MDFNIELAQELLESSDAFPVPLDRAWVWLGYSRKDKAVDTLKSYFEEGVDFSTERGKSPTGGRPSDSYHLTTNCLKEFGMIAKTEQGKLIRRYFLECEKLAKGQSQPHSKLHLAPFWYQRLTLFLAKFIIAVSIHLGQSSDSVSTIVFWDFSILPRHL